MMVAYDIHVKEFNKEEFDKVMPSIKVDGFIRKPAKVSELLETIKRYESMKQKPWAAEPIEQ